MRRALGLGCDGPWVGRALGKKDMGPWATKGSCSVSTFVARICSLSLSLSCSRSHEPSSHARSLSLLRLFFPAAYESVVELLAWSSRVVAIAASARRAGVALRRAAAAAAGELRETPFLFRVHRSDEARIEQESVLAF